MNKFAAKADFLKARAISLVRSGCSLSEAGRMLQTDKNTIHSWIKPEVREWRNLQKVISSAEKAAAARWSACELPTLAYIPKIELTPKSKYRMAAHG